MPAVMQYLTYSLSTHEMFIDHIYPIQVDDGHRKASNFYIAVHNCFGGGVPRWVCNSLCETWPLCVQQKLTRKASSAAHKPIVTNSFGLRGQVRKCSP
eukprot:396077-Pleurochrysis_carterae.AAC.1